MGDHLGLGDVVDNNMFPPLCKAMCDKGGHYSSQIYTPPKYESNLDNWLNPIQARTVIGTFLPR